MTLGFSRSKVKVKVTLQVFVCLFVCNYYVSDCHQRWYGEGKSSYDLAFFFSLVIVTLTLSTFYFAHCAKTIKPIVTKFNMVTFSSKRIHLFILVFLGQCHGDLADFYLLLKAQLQCVRLLIIAQKLSG